MELVRPSGACDHWIAAGGRDGVEVRFLGVGPAADRHQALAAAGGTRLELAWCRQIHSDRAVSASSGECGEADALITDRLGLALAVATADCVPVVVAHGRRLAVVHAGWRGIVAEIVPKTLERLGGDGTPIAWLGPAIGPCCYEVGRDVADAVVGASGPEALVEPTARTARAKPHLDLHRAVILQLQRSGIPDVERVDACTFCRADALASYRRQGAGAGRNLTFAWLEG